MEQNKTIYVVVEQLERYCLPTIINAFENIKDAVDFCEKEAGEQGSDWVRCPQDSSGFFFPTWKSSTPINRGTYGHEFMMIKEAPYTHKETA